jgi:hypothetical protein
VNPPSGGWNSYGVSAPVYSLQPASHPFLQIHASTGVISFKVDPSASLELLPAATQPQSPVCVLVVCTACCEVYAVFECSAPSPLTCFQTVRASDLVTSKTGPVCPSPWLLLQQQRGVGSRIK